ncbi:class I SAM-dependent methyltransferase [Tropicibacter sp. Alg240-R139]|uniref:class I SAM-dependent methyltransferase n=1 Tax=Tropicibacter sp. Alg240-R139 TaxID=2305991 RepID=UPI0013DF04A7|nr:SAM-dependent methyltransferase [Tropicibacter sp. Alg240-R139]
MTLKTLLQERIAHSGPMTVADYMNECLLHPDHGYYVTHEPFGTKGDFVTAPEISQMFGELIGLSLAQSWLDQGAPTPFTLAELGPGRGTLMADMLRATRGVPGFHDGAQIVLVEASPRLRAEQANTLDAQAPEWVSDSADLPMQPLFLVANEFFDALPIRQFVRSGAGWSERMIGASDTGDLMFGLGTVAPQPALQLRIGDTKDGDLVELCEAAPRIAQDIASRIALFDGAALLIDYGDWRSLGNTLQALQTHASIDPLDSPGQADLTAHVDFEVLAGSVSALDCRHSRLTPQGVFLERLGITARAQALAKGLGGAQLDALVSAHQRLTHPEEMGNLFKVLGLFPAQATPPPGLEP